MKYIHFSDLIKDEKALLDQHYEFYASLDQGTRIPTTEAQKHFVEVCRMQARPYSKHENVYLKYLKLLKQYNERNRRDKEEANKQRPMTKTKKRHKKDKAKPLILNKERLKEERKALSKLIVKKRNVRNALIVFPD